MVKYKKTNTVCLVLIIALAVMSCSPKMQQARIVLLPDTQTYAESILKYWIHKSTGLHAMPLKLILCYSRATLHRTTMTGNGK